MKFRAFTVAIAAFALGAAVFSAWNSMVIAKTPDLPIHGGGSWRSNASANGSWQADLALDGNTVSGVLAVSGNHEIGTASVSGAVSGNSLTLSVIQHGQQTGIFLGALNANALVGTYTTAAGDAGTWAGSWAADPPSIDAPISSSRLVSLAPKQTPDSPPMLSGIVLAARNASVAAQLGTSTSSTAPNLAVGSNVLVNNPNDAGAAQVEPSIAMDPNNANRVAAGAIDYSFGPQPLAGFYASTDGGATWPVSGHIPGLASGFTVGGDPVLAFDQSGRLYYAGMASTPALCSPGANSAIFVARSLNGGQSYQSAVLVASSPDSSVLFLDKPWMATDPASGNVYVTWTDVGNACATGTGQIWEAVSTNHGVSFDSGRPVSADTNSTASSVSVGTDGVVNVIWLRNGNQIVLARCAGGGTSCGANQGIANITPLPSLPGTTFRVNSWPMLAIDNVPNGNGSLTVVWADYRSGKAEIYAILSRDNGSTWTGPLLVAAASTDQFFPAISIDNAHLQRIVYYQRTSQSANLFNLFSVVGDSTGNFGSATKVNDGGDISPMNSAFFIGDYIGIASSPTSSLVNHPAWMDSRRSNDDIYSATVTGC